MKSLILPLTGLPELLVPTEDRGNELNFVPGPPSNARDICPFPFHVFCVSRLSRFRFQGRILKSGTDGLCRDRGRIGLSPVQCSCVRTHSQRTPCPHAARQTPPLFNATPPSIPTR